jgi:hypothetical protein
MSILRRRPREIYSVWPDGLEESPLAAGDDWELAVMEGIAPPAPIDPPAPAGEADAGQVVHRRRAARLPAVAAVSGASAALVVVTTVALERGTARRQPAARVRVAPPRRAASRQATARAPMPSGAMRRGRPEAVPRSSPTGVRARRSRARNHSPSALRNPAPVAPLPRPEIPAGVRRSAPPRPTAVGEFTFEGAAG